MKRGYFGIGIEQSSVSSNIGSLLRSAHAFGADYIFSIGTAYTECSTDTSKASRHIPFFTFSSIDEFLSSLPAKAVLVGVEFPHKDAKSIKNFCHPDQAVYVLGNEKRGLSEKIIGQCDRIVYVPTDLCLNVATAGSIIMFDRSMKVATRYK